MELSDPWNLAVFWTDPPRSMVCMEPWTGPRQSLISGDCKLEWPLGNSAASPPAMRGERCLNSR